MREIDGILFVVRHGRTALNAAGVLRGRIDPPLDSMGEAEAAALGALFSAVGVERVSCSPLRRAAQTADAIALGTNVTPPPDRAFLDRDYGPFNGQALAALLGRYSTVDDVPEVEPRSELVERVMTGVGRLLAGAAGPVMVVAHDAVNRAILGRDRSTEIEARRTQHDVDAKPIRTLTNAIESLPSP